MKILLKLEFLQVVISSLASCSVAKLNCFRKRFLLQRFFFLISLFFSTFMPFHKCSPLPVIWAHGHSLKRSQWKRKRELWLLSNENHILRFFILCRIVTGLCLWVRAWREVREDHDLKPRCLITRPKDARQYGNCFIARLFT